uniref:Uncharacterized protein n=1 Tax=Nelumbo nucifera TaxID=4432 RepID=A0A822Y8W1_NELNU|nr:TPA_asm: hypothetical protein HUJ06_030170 [Nelumbo nucifera]
MLKFQDETEKEEIWGRTVSNLLPPGLAISLFPSQTKPK